MKLSTYLKQLARNIRAARVRVGLRQHDVEELIGLTYRHYQNIEAGKINVRIGTLLILADLYETTVEELVRRRK